VVINNNIFGRYSTMSSSSIKLCETCNKPCSLACSVCKSAHFCDKECFKLGWKNHKQWCKSGNNTKGQKKAKKEYLKGVMHSSGGMAEAQKSTQQDRINTFHIAVTKAYVVMRDGIPINDLPSSIPDRARVTIVDNSTGSTLAAFNFLNPASLACEMYSNTYSGSQGEFKVLEGGWLYLVGQQDLFWSMIMHWHENGSTLPICARGLTWGKDTFLGTEYNNMEAKVASITANVTPGSRLKLSSESLAMCNLMQSDLSALMQGQCMHPAVDLIERDCSLPTTEGQVPPWWKKVRNVWDGALQRALTETSTGGARPQCMFHNVPVGCRIGVCNAWHDPAYKACVDEIRTPPRL
jgi:hypothetical protein